MLTKRKTGTQNQMYPGDFRTNRRSKLLKQSKFERLNETKTFCKVGICKEDKWRRIKHSVEKVFRKSMSNKQVPYTSLTRLDRPCVCKDKLLKARKTLVLSWKRTENIYCDNELENDKDDELDYCFDAVLRDRVQRSKSYSTRRMAICKEIEKSTGDKNRSLLELRKTLIMNNRFKEMGM